MNYSNLIQLFCHQSETQKDRECFRFKQGSDWKAYTYSEVMEKVLQLSKWISEQDIKKGDAVAILSKTRYEWVLADISLMALGAVAVPIYESNTPEQVRYILNDSKVKMIFVEDKQQLIKFQEIKDSVPCTKTVVLFDEAEVFENDVTKLKGIFDQGFEDDQMPLFQGKDELQPTDLASIVYTSGTTGDPKGVELTHGHFLSELSGLGKIIDISPEYRALLFLPLAHILGRVLYWVQFQFGFTQCFIEDLNKLAETIREVKPHFMGAVPRVFEKIHARILHKLDGGPLWKRSFFQWGFHIAKKRSGLIKKGAKPSLFLNLKYKLAYRVLFKKVHDQLGGEFQFFISGGAPLSFQVASFFEILGFTILEGYGLSETTAAITVNTPMAKKIGTVGKTLPQAEVRIEDDGEICVKGPMVFERYHNRPDETAQAFLEGGWFKTGDIGHLDEEGFLTITDRKKDVIVMANGKKVVPAVIENKVKSDPYISQCVLHGNNRKFISALITLNEEMIMQFAKSQGITENHFQKVLDDDLIRDFVTERIEAVNCDLARFEKIRKFETLPEDFSIENGELTPTLKIKRKVVDQKYRSIFDGFYQEEN